MRQWSRRPAWSQAPWQIRPTKQKAQKKRYTSKLETKHANCACEARVCGIIQNREPKLVHLRQERLPSQLVSPAAAPACKELRKVGELDRFACSPGPGLEPHHTVTSDPAPSVSSSAN
eukprot:765232-Hanusia_phi.AAC.10